MLRKALRGQAGRKVPATFAGLAAFIVAQCIRQGFGDLFRRRGREIGRVEGWGRVISHGPSMPRPIEQNKNLNR